MKRKNIKMTNKKNIYEISKVKISLVLNLFHLSMPRVHLIRSRRNSCVILPTLIKILENKNKKKIQIIMIEEDNCSMT